MRTVINVQFAVFAAIALTACALLAPMGADDEARRGAKITLAAYETTQQAILIYGRLPTCSPRLSLEGEGLGDAEAGMIRLCKQREVWAKIKIVEAAATHAIAEATPVLNGAEADAGQLVAALMAIENVRAAVTEAQTKMKEVK